MLSSKQPPTALKRIAIINKLYQNKVSRQGSNFLNY